MEVEVDGYMTIEQAGSAEGPEGICGITLESEHGTTAFIPLGVDAIRAIAPLMFEPLKVTLTLSLTAPVASPTATPARRDDGTQIG